MSEKKDVFRLEHVSKIFRANDGTEIRAVDDVSLTISEGEIFGIIGMSGAGKSTLVRTLNRLEEISEGRILYYDRDLGSLPARELRKERQSMAMIFQGFNLLMQKTVLANILTPMKIAKYEKSRRKERAMEVLRIVGLEDKAQAYPAQLSGGQRQRVAIARALAMNPKVLLCDEATSALDPKITEEILSLLRDINQRMNITVVIITHEMSVIEKICDRVAIIDHGKLAEVGDVQAIFTHPQSEAGRHLVIPQQTSNPFDAEDPERCIRIVFDGRSAMEPLICTLTETTGQKVNILSANTKSVNGVGYGQMIVELPANPADQRVVLDFLKERNVEISEVSA